MADLKISQLPASTTPLAGTEVLPIVQGTTPTTKQVSVADLTAGRAVSATQYTSTIATGTAPLVVASTTEVANLKAATATLADSATSANAIKSNATTGLLQVTGPAAASTRVMTTPDANFTVARTDTGQTFLGDQTLTTYTESVVAIGTVGASNTLSLANGTIQTATLTASTATTFTMPTATAGKSFVLFLKQAPSTGNGTATFTGVKWNTAGAPTITATAGKMDILSFFADGTNWYGSINQGFTP